MPLGRHLRMAGKKFCEARKGPACGLACEFVLQLAGNFRQRCSPSQSYIALLEFCRV
jgi:hypothetical protein